MVLLTFGRYYKHVVLGVGSFAVKIFQIDSKLARGFCQAVYFFKSEPKLAIKFTKAILVVRPVAVEIHRAIQPLLDHCPSPADIFLVTKHLKLRSSTIRIYGINTTGYFTRFVQLDTVLRN